VTREGFSATERVAWLVEVVTVADRSLAPLTLRLFGSFEVRLGDTPLPHLRSLKGQWLLALLTLRPGCEIPRLWLSGTLWPESDQKRAFANLRQTLRDLCRALGPESSRLRATPRTLSLDLEGSDVDVIAFDEAIRRGDPLSLEAAVSLYRGPLLEGCEELWVTGERDARERSYLAALEQLATSRQGSGDYATAERYLRLAVAADPSRESAWHSLMETLAGAGNYAEILQVFRELRAYLVRELEADPSPETVVLFEGLQEESRSRTMQRPPMRSSVPAFRPPCSLPRPLTPLIGREEAASRLRAALGSCRLITLCGSGGIGKTRLAIGVAEEVVERFHAGVWFVDLASQADPALVPQILTQCLGLGEASGRPPLERLREHLRDRSLLLVLDNCEHLVEACARVAGELLRHCPRLRILATSRQPLGVPGERTWRVPPLSLPAMVSPVVAATLTESAAVSLFLERATAVLPDFALDAGNASAIAQVCRQLDGIPLAIELAAARLATLSVQEIEERLEDRFGLLNQGPRTSTPRHQTLRALLDWSHDLLSEPERALFRRLSVFSGGWTLEAAEAVCEGQDAPAESGAGGERKGETIGPAQGARASPSSSPPLSEVLDLLSSLVEKSLVVWTEQDGRRRYHLLETIRSYASHTLTASGEAAEIRRRHGDFFLGLAEEAEFSLKGAEQAAWLERLEQEQDNLRAALRGSLPDGPSERHRADPASAAFCPLVGHFPPEDETGLRLTGALGKFWYVRGHLTEGRQWLERALREENAPAAPSSPTKARARALNWAGTLAWAQGDYACARAFHEASLAIRRALGDPFGISASLQNLASCIHGEPQTARSLYAESLALWRTLGNRHGIATALHNVGDAARMGGDYAAARMFQEQSLAIKRELGDQAGIAASLNNLGMVAYEEGDLAAARLYLAQSLAINRSLGNRHGIAASLNHLGNVVRLEGDLERARLLHEESLAIKRELGNKWGVIFSLEGLAGVTAARMLPEGARRAASLLGAAEALREAFGVALTPGEREQWTRDASTAQALLDAESFAAAWAKGRAMTLEEAVSCALGDADSES
jgi:predicted ATPase/DNA-binding SARP family transcriptional activator